MPNRILITGIGVTRSRAINRHRTSPKLMDVACPYDQNGRKYLKNIKKIVLEIRFNELISSKVDFNQPYMINN